MLGMIMSGYFIGFIGGTWVSGRLIRRMGHIRTFGFCASVCALGGAVASGLYQPMGMVALTDGVRAFVHYLNHRDRELVE
ncbi:hypothetical protein HSBAA_47870 [Vreelandella sulfidaeris]|uniref:Major facilitator superfamily (MFS) profile domain-containing protein n=1 Tax=Vreelandella sulfidaeris TaxID=115553 RepID=A0A455UFM7_9GAMM|nr:hypothetical protein HSBAA_47870 [Halomonas sulfidaeris]